MQHWHPYPVLRLTPSAMEVLTGGANVMILKRQTPAGAGESSNAKLLKNSDEQGAYDETLFDRLRSVRSKLARGRGVPAYIIFGDKTLRDMSRRMPVTLEEMIHVHGVGEAKLEQYGEAFVNEIAQYAAKKRQGT